MQTFLPARWLSLGSIAAFLALWQVSAVFGLLKDTIFPDPVGVLFAAKEAFFAGFLLEDSVASLARVLPGIIIGSLFGSAIGICTGRLRVLSDIIGPFLHFWRALPAVALIPVFIQLFGIDEKSKLIIISTGTFFPVWVSAHEGASLVDRRYLELARNYSLSRAIIFVKIIVPSTVPFVVAGVRTAIAVGYIMLFVSEWLGSSAGIGYRISIAHTVFRMDLMIFYLIELGFLALLTDASFKASVRVAFKWLEYSDD